MNPANAALAALLGYGLGSIPFGLVLTRAAGLGDIRNVGSGNIGATNVLRTGRRGLAAATLLLDAAKGVAAVLLAGVLLGPLAAAIAAVAAVLGHCFPVWLGFKGGKGVATGLGVIAALDWRVGALACLAWLGVAAASRISSAGALAAFLAAPVAGALLAGSPSWAAPLAIAAIVVARHRANIERLLTGTEPRIGRKAGGV